jgi:O-methyltransferase
MSQLQFRDYKSFIMSEYMNFFRKVFQMQNFNGITGDYVEFGCHGALTFPTAYQASGVATHQVDRHFWAFDSFAGLPDSSLPEDEHPMWVAGEYRTSQDDFIKKCTDRGIPENKFSVVPGYFEDTIGNPTENKHTLPKDIAFVFVDCDMYSSTQTVLKYIEPFVKNGMVIAFDDYYCYSSQYPSGERLAFIEMLKEHPTFDMLEYSNFHWGGASYIVESRK